MKTFGGRLGILGCGAIANALADHLASRAFSWRLSALFDQNLDAARSLAGRLRRRPRVVASLEKLVSASDLIVEAAAVSAVLPAAKACLPRRRPLVVMSVGGYWLNERKLRAMAKKYRTKVYLPSGAVGALDALRASKALGLKNVSLETRKPPRALSGAPSVSHELSERRKELLFEGNVRQAVRKFPANLNVAAVLAAACGRNNLRVRLFSDPSTRFNRHLIEASGEAGRFTFETENRPSSMNPKTSALAIGSLLALLERLGSEVEVGS